MTVIFYKTSYDFVVQLLQVAVNLKLIDFNTAYACLRDGIEKVF